MSRLSNSTAASQRASRAVGSNYDVIMRDAGTHAVRHKQKLQCESTYQPHLQTTPRPLFLVCCRIVLECISNCNCDIRFSLAVAVEFSGMLQL